MCIPLLVLREILISTLTDRDFYDISKIQSLVRLDNARGPRPLTLEDSWWRLTKRSVQISSPNGLRASLGRLERRRSGVGCTKEDPCWLRVRERSVVLSGSDTGQVANWGIGEIRTIIRLSEFVSNVPQI